MKNLFLLITFLSVWTAKAQSWSGTYDTKYGKVNLIEELGFEYGSDASIVYGDYGTNGTIVGVLKNKASELHGTFFNGNSIGKFIWLRTGATSFSNNSFSGSQFIGYYGYGNNNNENTSDEAWHWTGNRISNTKLTNLVTAIWSGKWNSSFGDLILEQVGNKVTGKYKNVGNIDAIYDKNTKKLKGTFTNNGITGYLEFTFEGNTFKGKWGWTSAMTEKDAWNGTKNEKTNKIISPNSTPNTNTNNQTAQNNQNQTVKIRVKATFAKSASNSILTEPDLYGFAGFDVKKLTQTKTEDVLSFGNKTKYIFEKTENSPLIIDQIYYQFPDNPSYYRDYVISKADWENPNIYFELVVFHHLKANEHGQINGDCGYVKEVYNLKNLINKQHKLPNTDTRVCYLNFVVQKL